MQKRWIIPCLLLLTLCGCQHKHTSAATYRHKWTLTPRPSSQPLYFSSHLQSNHIQLVSSPVDGLLRTYYFQPGEYVRLQSKLLLLDSKEFSTTYHKALIHWFHQTHDLKRSQAAYKAYHELWKQGIVSRNSYQDIQQKYLSDVLANIQVKKHFLQIAHGHIPAALGDLTIHQLQKLLQHDDSQFTLYASMAGQVFPVESSHKTQGKSMPALTPGAEIKKNQPLLQIVDAHHLFVIIQIPETQIYIIHRNQGVIVTGKGFPGRLRGHITGVMSAQAHLSASNTVAYFPVRIILQPASPEQQQAIRLGMTVKVAILPIQTDKIFIPLKAVKIQREQPYVKVLLQCSGPSMAGHWIRIETGETTEQDVEIVKGLHQGACIWIP